MDDDLFIKYAVGQPCTHALPNGFEDSAGVFEAMKKDASNILLIGIPDIQKHEAKAFKRPIYAGLLTGPDAMMMCFEFRSAANKPVLQFACTFNPCLIPPDNYSSMLEHGQPLGTFHLSVAVVVLDTQAEPIVRNLRLVTFSKTLTSEFIKTSNALYEQQADPTETFDAWHKVPVDRLFKHVSLERLGTAD